MSDELVREWVKKGEEDWRVLERLRERGLSEVAGAASFHAQQCAEKYLKALLEKRGLEPPRTHHLPVILDILGGSLQGLEQIRGACEALAPYAVNFRSPGGEADEEDAIEAVGHAERVRSVVRRDLGLDVG